MYLPTIWPRALWTLVVLPVVDSWPMTLLLTSSISVVPWLSVEEVPTLRPDQS